MSGLRPETARRWLASWAAQQVGYLPRREERFEAIIDAVAEAIGRPDPLVVDPGVGPGSPAARLPRATVVGVDADVLLPQWAEGGGFHRKRRDLSVRG